MPSTRAGSKKSLMCRSWTCFLDTRQMLFARIYKATVREARVSRVAGRKRLCQIRKFTRDRPFVATVGVGNDKTGTRSVLGGMFLKLTPFRSSAHPHH